MKPSQALLIMSISLAVAVARGQGPVGRSPLQITALSQLATASGKLVDGGEYYEAADCGDCHARAHANWQGSAHNRAHTDSLYLAFAELARKEGGDDLYAFCSACHAPLAVASGELPGKPGGEKTFASDEGVTCDGCHSAARVREVHAGAGANASLVIEEGETRYGPFADADPEASHDSAFSEIHTRSEFCAACHTLVHPVNGLVIENTFHEWQRGPYAAAGIQCQDCHMRTVDQAREVARTMKPIEVPGKAAEDSATRPNVSTHLFVGANVNRAAVGLDVRHAEAAEARLKSAATLALHLPAHVARGAGADMRVDVTNVGAGHAIPTSITELRQMWIALTVSDADGREVFEEGAVGEDGAVDPKAPMFHARLADAEGNPTHLPWRAAKMIEERLIGPKQTVSERYTVRVPAGAKGPLKVRAALRYRSAPQEVLDELLGKGRFPVRVVDMAIQTGEIRIR